MHSTRDLALGSLLSFVDDVPDQRERLTVEKERLQKEIGRLLESIAHGIDATTIAPKVKERQDQIAKIDRAFRTPHPVPVNKAKVRAALEQRVAEWKEILRSEPSVAKALLKHIIGPIELWNGSEVPNPALLAEFGTPHWSQVPGGVPEPGAAPPPQKVSQRI